MAESSHANVVAEWMEHALDGRATRDVVPIFAAALLAVWDRSHVTLGDVSLRAMVERVLHGARARFPIVRALAIEASPESFQALRDRDGSMLDRAELVTAMQIVLTEILTLLGTLTAQILTPALHDALRAVELPSASASNVVAAKGAAPS